MDRYCMCKKAVLMEKLFQLNKTHWLIVFAPVLCNAAESSVIQRTATNIYLFIAHQQKVIRFFLLKHLFNDNIWKAKKKMFITLYTI